MRVLAEIHSPNAGSLLSTHIFPQGQVHLACSSVQIYISIVSKHNSADFILHVKTKFAKQHKISFGAHVKYDYISWLIVIEREWELMNGLFQTDVQSFCTLNGHAVTSCLQQHIQSITHRLWEDLALNCDLLFGSQTDPVLKNADLFWGKDLQICRFKRVNSSIFLLSFPYFLLCNDQSSSKANRLDRCSPGLFTSELSRHSCNSQQLFFSHTSLRHSLEQRFFLRTISFS